MKYKDNQIIITIGELKRIKAYLKKYFGFDEYNTFFYEQAEAVRKNGDMELNAKYHKSETIDVLPDDIFIYIQYANCANVYRVLEESVYKDEDILNVLLLAHVIGHWGCCGYVYESVDDFHRNIISEDQNKLYNFILENKKRIDYDKPENDNIELKYSNKKIKIDNRCNWFYDLIEKALYDELTNSGQTEFIPFDFSKNKDIPSRQPNFGHYMVYNTYLFLIETFYKGKQTYNMEFCLFIITFVSATKAWLSIGKLNKYSIVDMLKGLYKTYNGNPIPSFKVKKVNCRVD